MVERRKLTDAFIASLRPLPVNSRRERARFEYFDSEVRQLSVRISHTGVKTFLLRGRFPGGRNSVQRAVGAADMGVSEARKRARSMLNQVADGVDPADERRRKREDERKRRDAERHAADSTVEIVAEKLFASREHLRKRTAGVIERRLRNEVLPVWGARPVGDIGEDDVCELLRQITERSIERGGSGRYGHSIWDDLSGLFRFAHKKLKVIAHSPFRDLERRDVLEPKLVGERVLSDLEIVAFWRATERMGAPYGKLYQLVALSGLRLLEAAHAQEGELDDEAWTVPATRMKGIDGRVMPHVVPMTPGIKAIFDSLPSNSDGPFRFSSQNGAAPVNAFGWASTRLRALMREELAKLRDGDDTLKPFGCHDLRRTLRTGLSRLRVDFEVREAVLAHVKTGLVKAYDKFDLFDQKREALEKWEQFVMDLLQPPAAKVVPLRRVAKR